MKYDCHACEWCCFDAFEQHRYCAAYRYGFPTIGEECKKFERYSGAEQKKDIEG